MAVDSEPKKDYNHTSSTYSATYKMLQRLLYITRARGERFFCMKTKPAKWDIYFFSSDSIKT